MFDVVASLLATTTVFLGDGMSFWTKGADWFKKFFYDGMAVLGGKGLGFALVGLSIFFGIGGLIQRHFFPNAQVRFPELWVAILLGAVGALLAFTGVEWLVNILKAIGEWIKELMPS